MMGILDTYSFEYWTHRGVVFVSPPIGGHLFDHHLWSRYIVPRDHINIYNPELRRLKGQHTLAFSHFYHL